MGCAEKDCYTAFAKDDDLSFPGTEGHGTPWKFYNHLIGHVPEDLVVRDYCLGTHWSYVEADCGMGISFTCKGGAKRSDILALAHHALQCPHLRLRGIMSIPPATATEEENKAFFQETYQLFIDMRNELGDNVSNIDCLSMGMSGDYPLAIAGGSTMVRVGTALFGARPPWHPQG